MRIMVVMNLYNKHQLLGCWFWERTKETTHEKTIECSSKKGIKEFNARRKG